MSKQTHLRTRQDCSSGSLHQRIQKQLSDGRPGWRVTLWALVAPEFELDLRLRSGSCVNISRGVYPGLRWLRCLVVVCTSCVILNTAGLNCHIP